MNSLALFGLSVLMSVVAFGIVTKIYIWPRLRITRREAALIALAVPHTFRFIGLSFVIGWRASETSGNRNIGQPVCVMKMAGNAGSQRKRQTSKKVLEIAEGLESAVKDWRILTQGQKVLDQLNERFSGPDAYPGPASDCWFPP